MGLLDKILGRGKKAAGDVTGDSSLRREGAAQEREAAAEDRAATHPELSWQPTLPSRAPTAARRDGRSQ